jgi:hypothetical protein
MNGAMRWQKPGEEWGWGWVKLSLKQDKHATKLEKIAFPIHLSAFTLQSHVVITQEMLFCFYNG